VQRPRRVALGRDAHFETRRFGDAQQFDAEAGVVGDREPIDGGDAAARLPGR
jgi:hypothetical protein